MSVTAESLRRSGRYAVLNSGRSEFVQPRNLADLRRIMALDSRQPTPFRPAGAGSASTDCNTASTGTTIDMCALDDVLNVDAYNGRITVRAGARLSKVAEALAEEGMELEGSFDLPSRTVGGAVAGGCIGPSIGSEGALFGSQVLSLKVVTPTGKLLSVDSSKANLLGAFRLSYGMLGIIYEVTLKARPITGFNATHRRCTVDQLSKAAGQLAKTNVGMKFMLLPFRDTVYLDVRRFDSAASAGRKFGWKLKDWGESTVMPQVFRSLNTLVPMSGMRYSIVDRVSAMTQGIVSGRLVNSGSSSTAHARGGSDGTNFRYSTWFFPASDFAIVVKAYRDFCLRIREETGFRCDMPTVGYRLNRDQSAYLSPAYDEPMVALRAVSTPTSGWENFAIDFGEFARSWGGTPMFNQTQELDPAYARQVFGRRLDFFRRMRRQLDPDNRMMNPFLSQYFL
ncbi:MAG: FAD-binding oxidoreductase [Gammaproteobacteria bacterium]|nr:FAD-binding oxidoreductase [Gammaproteobacteria bacterium]MDH4255274.1 FAD-binding oxidoreductase [Gammaproteobacteria bacterium]MDH5310005.1 FAD-binding oxidoreductase [Gammaproteobacteria bacterium]